MALLTLTRAELAFGTLHLLDAVDLSLPRGTRAALIGRNGAGKSTLLKVINGEQTLDSGQRVVESGLRIALMDQQPRATRAATVGDMVGELAQTVDAFQAPSHLPPEQRCAALLGRFGLDPNAAIDSLSGGARRKADLACALAIEPDILLLDEPTNHLDLDAIAALADLITRFAGAVVFITHDRAFLRDVATAIWELDRGHLTTWPGDYANYLRRRAERDHAEAKQNALFDKHLAAEEVWIRKGIEARRTRNEGRVRALEKLRRDRAARREKAATVRLESAQARASGRLVVDAQNVSFARGERALVSDFSAQILRGDRIGILGPNGIGKTTLIRLLLGELKPDAGSIELGTQLEVAYFDQARLSLDERLSALENVAEGRTHIRLGDSNPHIIGYLGDFLFSPEQALAPISRLSGGERNRLLLAKLFSKPHNLLVLDEPTNDLDLETLELLEDKLANYPGTLLLVSHDREFVDNVVTSTFALEGAGRIVENVGGYSDWLRARSGPVEVPAAVSKAGAAPAPPKPVSTKLSYKDKRELELLPAQIEALEAEQAALNSAMANPAFFRQPAAEITAAQRKIGDLALKLEQAYARWQTLDALA
jgi:ABC transport system ATP-binding/permease protein